MNIFYLDRDPKIIAQELCDKHIVKMPLESAQMLCTAWRAKTSPYDKVARQKLVGLYKAVHVKHPSTIWTYSSEGNYLWHFKLFKAMLEEYTRRYNKVHASSKLLKQLAESPMKGGEFYPPPQCMPDEYKCEDTIQAYRNYYIAEKKHFAKYKLGGKPEWL